MDKVVDIAKIVQMYYEEYGISWNDSIEKVKKLLGPTDQS